jgi:hypothetical protein
LISASYEKARSDAGFFVDEGFYETVGARLAREGASAFDGFR